MTILTRWWQSEPARLGAAVVIFVNSVIALAASMGWLDLTAEQLALVYLVVVNGLVLVFGEGVRTRVSPNGRDPVEDDDA
jgi:hypothetical protein